MAEWACTVRQGVEAASYETVHGATHRPPASYCLLRAELRCLANHTLEVLFIGKAEQKVYTHHSLMWPWSRLLDTRGGTAGTRRWAGPLADDAFHLLLQHPHWHAARAEPVACRDLGQRRREASQMVHTRAQLAAQQRRGRLAAVEAVAVVLRRARRPKDWHQRGVCDGAMQTLAPRCRTWSSSNSLEEISSSTDDPSDSSSCAPRHVSGGQELPRRGLGNAQQRASGTPLSCPPHNPPPCLHSWSMPWPAERSARSLAQIKVAVRRPACV